MAVLDATTLTGIGVVLDADGAATPAERYAAIAAGLRATGLPLGDVLGGVTGDRPRHGCFVLPDNGSQGTLETLLLECAGSAYPGLLASATRHVDAAHADATLTADDLIELRKPAGRSKAIVGAIASVLRPGKAVQVSIQDNRWLCGPSLLMPRVAAAQQFLVNLFELIYRGRV